MEESAASKGGEPSLQELPPAPEPLGEGNGGGVAQQLSLRNMTPTPSPRGTVREGQGQQALQLSGVQILPQGACTSHIHKGGRRSPLPFAVAGAVGEGKEKGAAAAPYANFVQ